MSKLESSIIKLRKEGLSVNKISEKLKCSKGVISYHINKHNLGGSLVKKIIKTDDDFIIEIGGNKILDIISFRENGKTYNDILTHIKISKDKLKRICRIYGLNGSVAKNNKIITSDDIDNIRKLYIKIKNIKKVGKELNFSPQTVSKYCKDLMNKPTDNLSRNEQVVRNVSNFRRKRKLDLINYKGGCCEKCGYNKCNKALAFHHLNPDNKSFSIGGKNYSWEIMKKEVDKCILVCSNCHAEIHENLEINKSFANQ